jgi:hypothetical protein
LRDRHRALRHHPGTRGVLEKITADLRKRPARCALGEKKHKLTNATINRYLNAASAVLTYAELHKLITNRPKAPCSLRTDASARSCRP